MMLTVPLRFVVASAYTLQFEGDHFVDAPADRGGPTRFGITQKFLAGHRIPGEVRDLTVGEAIQIYYDHYWLPAHLNDVLYAPVALKIFDLAVLTGSAQAGHFVQRILLDMHYAVMVDGIFSSHTIDALNRVPSTPMVSALCTFARRFFEGIVERDATQRVWLKGWTRRALSDPTPFCFGI